MRARRPRGVAAGAALLCALVALPTSCSGPVPADRSGGALRFAACGDAANWAAAGPGPERRRLLDIGCAVLPVPRDHARPGDGTLPMAVMRVRHARLHDRLGSLVLNPGGPAGSGLDAMPGWATWFPEELLERFDLVTFDPRGTGGSSPLTCAGGPDDAAGPLAGVLDDQAFSEEQDRAAVRAEACARAVAATSGSFGTDAVARDLDLLRASLGDDRLSYVGWSYGARLGAHYAHLFPDRVRALVLDSPPHPTAPWPTVVGAQAGAFEAALTDYVETCPVRNTCAAVAGNPREVLDRVLRRARSTPIRSGRPAHDPPATWDVVVRSVLAHLPTPELWPMLDGALSEADGGDSGSLYDVLDAIEGKTPAHPGTDTSDAQQIVQCTDSAPEPDVAALRADAARLVARHPTLGPYAAWWLFACTPWTAPRSPLPPPVTTTAAPILVIGGTADPSTPIDGARALAQVLGPSTALLTSGLPGHTSFGRSPCAERHVVRLLVARAAIAPHATCP